MSTTQPTPEPCKKNDPVFLTDTPAPTPRTDANCWDTLAGAMRCKATSPHAYVPADFARTLERELAAKDAEIARLKETGLPQTCAVKFPTDNGLGYFIGTDEFGKRLIESFIARAEAATARVTELERLLANLTQAVENTLGNIPGYHEGNFIVMHYDGEGRELGPEYIDPFTVVGHIDQSLRAAIDAARTRKEGV